MPIMRTELSTSHLLKLATWLSPAFPIGAFAYSHGLEYAVEAGLADDRAGLEAWGRYLLAHGPVRQDAVLLARAWREFDSPAALVETATIAAALKGTPELAQETIVQGEAFLRTVRAAWPTDALNPADDALSGRRITLPVAVGISAAAHGLPLREVLVVYLHAFVSNLTSTAMRLSVIGQTDGQRILAALEEAIVQAADAALSADADDLGAAAGIVDWCSMQHETQHTRLFRS
jgi:urease accessory protein